METETTPAVTDTGETSENEAYTAAVGDDYTAVVENQSVIIEQNNVIIEQNGSVIEIISMCFFLFLALFVGKILFKVMSVIDGA